MLHMSEYLTSKERHTYLHLENTSHSSLLWLSQKGLVFRVLGTMQCFPPRRAQRLGWGPNCWQTALSDSRWLCVPVALVTPEPAARGCWAGCTFTLEGSSRTPLEHDFMAFLLVRGEELGHSYSHCLTPYKTPIKTSLCQGPQNSLLKLNNKKGKKTPALTPLVSYWDVLGLPPHTFSCIAATDPSWRTPWAESVPVAVVRR